MNFINILTVGLVVYGAIFCLASSPTNVNELNYTGGTSTSPMKVSVEIVGHGFRFGPGESVSIAILVENISKQFLDLPLSCDSLDNKITIVDEDGNTPSLTKVGKKITNPLQMPCARRSRRLQAGESKLVVLDLTEMYDLSKSAKYSVTVARSARASDGTWTTVSSIPISFVVR